MLRQLQSGDMSSGADKGRKEKTNRYCFSAEVRERSLGSDAACAEEVAFCTSEPIIVRERSWVLPVPEPDAIVSWTSTQIDNDTKNDHACYRGDFD